MATPAHAASHGSSVEVHIEAFLRKYTPALEAQLREARARLRARSSAAPTQGCDQFMNTAGGNRIVAAAAHPGSAAPSIVVLSTSDGSR